MKKLKVGTRVEVIGKCKSQFRQGVVTFSPYRSDLDYVKMSVRLDATSTQPACNITILRKNVEAV